MYAVLIVGPFSSLLLLRFGRHIQYRYLYMAHKSTFQHSERSAEVLVAIRRVSIVLEGCVCDAPCVGHFVCLGESVFGVQIHV